MEVPKIEIFFLIPNKMKENLHSIQKVFLEIDTTSTKTADSIKNNLAVFLQNEVFPILEKYFSSVKNIDNQIVQIEKLHFTIDSQNPKNDFSLFNIETKNDIKNQIEKEARKTFQEFENKIQNKTVNETSEMLVVSPKDKQIKTLLYFIENGNMPWWITQTEEISFFENIPFDEIQNQNFKNSFQQIIMKKKVQEIIVNQFSNYQIALLGSVFSSSTSKMNQEKLSANKILKIIENQSHHFKASFWKMIFEVWNKHQNSAPISYYYENKSFFSAKKISFDHFIKSIKEFANPDLKEEDLKKIKIKYNDVSIESKSIGKSTETSTKQQQITSKENQKLDVKSDIKLENSLSNEHKINEDFDADESFNSKSCYVQNAGLILLHPFIKDLFKNCDLIDDNHLIANKELAAHLLHYTAAKKENDYEQTMLFEKFLCGIPLNESIKREIKIDDKHKKHIEEMLDAAVEHWSALKNTSTAILRTEFLQREGKLDWSESNPKLTIERKTQDLLLEKIPWNISIVKIPWIDKLIYTQW
jgi:hypothetical protein